MSFHNTFVPDPRLAPNASKAFDAPAWVDLDGRIVDLQTLLARCLLRGLVATYAQVDSAASAIARGDVLIRAGIVEGAATVRRMTSSDIASGFQPLGIAIEAAPPGAKVPIALAGLLSPSVTGLGTTAGAVRVSSAGRAERVASLAGGDIQLGYVDANGWLLLVRELAGGGGGGGGSYSAGDGLALVGSVFSVSPDADGSIAFGGGGDLKVGILATDAQHGNRGGGSLHVAANGSTAGFLTAAHYTLLASATANATASALFQRDGSGGGKLAQFAASSSGVWIGVTPTFGGGSRLLGIEECTTLPTSNPTTGVLIRVESSDLKSQSVWGVVSTLAPAGNASSTIAELDRKCARATTTNTNATNAFSVKVDTSDMAAEFDVSVLAFRSDSVARFRRTVLARNVAGTVTIRAQTSATGPADAPDVDEIGGCSVAFSVSGDSVVCAVQCTTGGTVGWLCESQIRKFKP